MKKIFFLCILFANIAISANASLLNFKSRAYYATCSLAANGGICVYNNLCIETLFLGNSLSSVGQTKVRCIKSSSEDKDAIYSATDTYSTAKYVVSPDCKHMAIILYMGKDWVMTTWYTTSKNEQLTFYENNKYYQTEGIKYDFSDSNSTNSNSSSNHKKSGSSCSECGGSGIDPRPVQCYGYTSWLAEYNSEGNKCRICGKYSEHYHTRCSHCSTPNH